MGNEKMILNYCIYCEEIWVKINTEEKSNFGLHARVCQSCTGKHLLKLSKHNTTSGRNN